MTAMPVQRPILFIGSVWPEPRSTAAGSYLLQLVELFLAQGRTVIFASTAARGPQSADLQALGVCEQTIAMNCSSFDIWLAELQPQVVLFDRFMIEEQFGWRVEQACPHTLRVLVSQDLHSLRQVRQQILKEKKTPALCLPEDGTRLLQAMQESDIALREVASIYRCDLSLMISDMEIKLLTESFQVPGHILFHCPFLLPLPDTSQRLDFSARQHFITIGTFLHAPNLDAVLYLREHIWPLIREQLPEAQVFNYGAHLPERIRTLHKPAQGFHVCGWAEDAHAVVSRVRVCLAPLRFGAGIKGKLAEAMLCGTPSVTTTIGAEAMHGELPWSGSIANDAQAFADAAVRLHENETFWQQSQKNGLAILRKRFDGDAIGTQLMQQLHEITANLETHRRRNFTGSMLRHHLHKSTHYMSRWIESKNALAQLQKRDGDQQT